MPVFITQRWCEYDIKLTPRDFVRNQIRELLARRDVIPYFYGPLSFDLAISFPRAKRKILADKEIKYEWVFCSSKDNKEIKAGEDVMPLASTKRFNLRNVKAGDITHYRYASNRYLLKHMAFRKIQAIDLGHVSILDQYKIEMRFTDQTGNVSELMIMLEFTLQDRDNFSLSIISILVGAGIAIVAGIIGYMLGMR